MEGTKQEHMIDEDSDGSRISGHFLGNIQGTTLQANDGDDECMEQPDANNVAIGMRLLNHDPIGMCW